jgi:hypothetical protein
MDMFGIGNAVKIAVNMVRRVSRNTGRRKLLLNTVQCDDLCNNAPVVKAMPPEGERKLCLFHGEWIVLQVDLETPSYEENFMPFLYWREPFSDTICIEHHDVSTWVDLPEIPTEEIKL